MLWHMHDMLAQKRLGLQTAAVSHFWSSPASILDFFSLNNYISPPPPPHPLCQVIGNIEAPRACLFVGAHTDL